LTAQLMVLKLAAILCGMIASARILHDAPLGLAIVFRYVWGKFVRSLMSVLFLLRSPSLGSAL
jgi:hypothetical protein